MYSWPLRKHLRLKDYDYSQDWIYFATFCSYKKQCFFWDIIDGRMVLNDYGKLVEKEILKTEEIRDEIFVNSYIIMPNHIHILIEIKWVETTGRVRMHSHPTAQDKSSWVFDERWALWLRWNNISSVMRGLKASITKNIRKQFNDYEFKWQRSFYDVIIKNEEQLNKTRLYIEQNPLKWHLDVNNPDNEEKMKELRRQGKRRGSNYY